MGCSCILLTWACRNRQGSITSRVAKFGKRIKETAIPCLADSMASILPFQVHGHSPDAGRQRPLRQAGRQAQGRGPFPFRGAVLSTGRAANWAAGRAEAGQQAGRAPFPGQRPCCPFAGQGSLPRSLLPCLAVMRRVTAQRARLRPQHHHPSQFRHGNSTAPSARCARYAHSRHTQRQGIRRTTRGHTGR